MKQSKPFMFSFLSVIQICQVIKAIKRTTFLIVPQVELLDKFLFNKLGWWIFFNNLTKYYRKFNTYSAFIAFPVVLVYCSSSALNFIFYTSFTISKHTKHPHWNFVPLRNNIPFKKTPNFKVHLLEVTTRKAIKPLQMSFIFENHLLRFW